MTTAHTSDCNRTTICAELVQRLDVMANGLRWLVRNGPECPRESANLPPYIHGGVCGVVFRFCHEHHGLPEYDRVYRIAMREIGTTSFVIDVVPGMHAIMQYYAFTRNVEQGKYSVGLTESEFKLYASARILLITKVKEAIVRYGELI